MTLSKLINLAGGPLFGGEFRIPLLLGLERLPFMLVLVENASGRFFLGSRIDPDHRSRLEVELGDLSVRIFAMANAVGGIGGLAAAAYLSSLDLPAALWWWPWLFLTGGVFLLASAAIRAWIERQR